METSVKQKEKKKVVYILQTIGFCFLACMLNYCTINNEKEQNASNKDTVTAIEETSITGNDKVEDKEEIKIEVTDGDDHSIIIKFPFLP